MEKRDLTLAVAITALVLTSGTSKAAERTTLSVVLHLTDFAGINPRGLARARDETERIYRNIDVRVRWVNVADGPEAQACEGHNLFVSLLSPFLVKQVALQVGSSVLGTASPSTSHAFILTERITELAAHRRIEEGVLLGRAIAHEVGHLLLNNRSHSQRGVMTAGVDTDPLGRGTYFLPPERLTIRARLETVVDGENRNCASRAAAGAR